MNRIFERHLTENAQWRYIAGDELSIGDFKCLARYHSTVLNKTKKHAEVASQWERDFQKHPKLGQYLERAKKPFETYLSGRPLCII